MSQESSSKLSGRAGNKNGEVRERKWHGRGRVYNEGKGEDTCGKEEILLCFHTKGIFARFEGEKYLEGQIETFWTHQSGK